MRKFMLAACLFALLLTGCGRLGESTQDKQRPTVTQPQAMVYVSGFVQRPGTYHVPVGTPVGEVIKLAGGLRPEADAARIDQNEAVQATMQVYVPKQGEWVPPAAAAPAAAAPSGSSVYEPPAAAAAPARVYRGQASLAATGLELEMLGLMNSERASCGAAPLALDSQLVKIARLKSQDMIDNKYFSHYSPRYGSPSSMVAAHGVSYHYVGENIAQGMATVARAHEGLMGSPGHRQAILNPEYRKVGIGIVSAGGVLTVTQIFTD